MKKFEYLEQRNKDFEELFAAIFAANKEIKIPLPKKIEENQIITDVTSGEFLAKYRYIL